MKKMILVLAMFIGTNASAVIYNEGPATETPNFSAFVKDNVLYATIMGDSCNTYIGSLKVDGLCQKGRMILNYAEECDATLEVSITRMYCYDQTPTPHVVKIDLNEAGVTEEAKVLHLKYVDQVIDVQIVK